MSNSDNNFSEEQLWQAFRFVSGELSEAEERVFEEDLAANGTMCEAIAEATKLAWLVSDSSISSAPSVMIAERSVPRSHSRSRGAAAIVTSTVAACCLLIGALVSNQQVSKDNTPLTSAVSPETELIVGAWVDNADESVDELSDEEPVEELDVPDWMLAAVELGALEEDSLMNPDQG